METLKYYLLKLFTPIRFLLVFFFLPKHKFKCADLIFKEGTRTLYEVDSLYYNTNLQPIVIVRAYPMGNQLMGINYHEVKEFREYKKPVDSGKAATLLQPSDVGSTAHDNDKFGKKKNGGKS